jgi:hypothetical protein
VNYHHLRRLLGGENARKDDNERFFERLRIVVGGVFEEKLKELGKSGLAKLSADELTELLKLEAESRSGGGTLPPRTGVGQAPDAGVPSPQPPTPPVPRLEQRYKAVDPSGDRNSARQALDFPTDSESLVRAYQNALRSRELGKLLSDLSLPGNVTQAKRVEVWIPAAHSGKMGFIVIPNPEFHDEELGRQLQKLYGLIRMDKVPIAAWNLLAPAWVDGNRAAAHNYDPMEFDPSGDFLAGRLERSDARLKQ